MKNLFLFLIFLIASVFNPLQAQEEDSSSCKDKDNKWDWNWNWENEWWDWHLDQPFIELNYGFGEAKHKNLKSSLANVGLAEIKIGYSTNNETESCGQIIKFKDKYSFVSRIGTHLHSKKAKTTELPSDLWRFGFGKRTGYGYNFNSIRILPYTQEAAVWSKLEMKDYPVSIFPAITFSDAVNDTEILQRYDGNFRFGTLNEGGIRLEIASLISFNAGYEAAVIFPRHLFWKHLASYAIESAAQHALDKFVREVVDSSPYAGPIVSFVLKNGLSYAFYSLKKEKMNWPFNTETPLTYETVKLGVTLSF